MWRSARRVFTHTHDVLVVELAHHARLLEKLVALVAARLNGTAARECHASRPRVPHLALHRLDGDLLGALLRDVLGEIHLQPIIDRPG